MQKQGFGRGSVVAAVLMALVSAASSQWASAAQININVGGAGNPMLSTEMAGAPQARDDNWNNLLGDISAGPLSLFDGAGASTTATASFAGSGLVNTGVGTDNGKFFSSNFDAFGANSLRVDVSGIPYARYDVYAYHQGGAPEGLFRVAAFTIEKMDLFALRPRDEAYSRSTSTQDLGTQTMPGTYVVFEGLSGADFTLIIGGASASDGVLRNRFAGLQIVQVDGGVSIPEPATLVLMIIGGGAMLLRRGGGQAVGRWS